MDTYMDTMLEHPSLRGREPLDILALPARLERAAHGLEMRALHMSPCKPE